MIITITKSLQIIPAVLILLAASQGSSQASYAQLTSASQLSAGNTVATYPQPDAASVASPYTLATGTNSLTFSTSSNSAFTVQHQGTSFFGDFPSGTPLLYNAGKGSDLIAFSLPISQFGVTVESNVIASHTFTITLLSGTTTDFAYTFTDGGLSTFFLGAQGTASSTFDRVRIASDDNDFAIGPVSFSSGAASPVPEPSSWILLGSGVTLLAWARRQLRLKF